MAIDNTTVLENLKKQKAELEQQLEGGREMYLKVVGAIEILEQIESVKEQEAPESESTEVTEQE
jgi:hypothetical protein